MSLLTTLAVSSLPVAAQTAAVPIGWERHFDDSVPTSGPNEGSGVSGASLVFDMPRAISVTRADFNQDGLLDVVLGANSVPHPTSQPQGTAPTGGPLAGVVVHLSLLGHAWNIGHQYSLGPQSGNCYDLDAGDVDGDGDTDVVVGRRLVMPTGGWGSGDWNSVFLNTTTAASSTASFGSPIPMLHPVTMTDDTSHLRETFGLELFDLDNDGDLECVTTGMGFGIRYYAWNGTELAFMKEYRAASSLSGGGSSPDPSETYRQVALGDVDGDGDLDLVVPRNTGGAQTVTVWLSDVASSFSDPFSELSTSNPITATSRSSITAESVDPTGTPCSTPTLPGGGSVTLTSVAEHALFEVALGDLDGDGSIDMVTADPGSDNCAYLNDGSGHFGSSPTSSDGLPAYVFPAVTPDWQGASPGLAHLFFHGSADPATSFWNGETPESFPLPIPEHDSGCGWRYTVPGTMLNHTTGVSLFDLDDDGTVDLVGFSNRNDWQEELSSELPFMTLAYIGHLLAMSGGPFYTSIDDLVEGEFGVDENGAASTALHTGSSSSAAVNLLANTCHYLAPAAANNPAPDVHDHVFFNTTTTPGTLSFSEHVELLGEANDGTAYGEFVQFDREQPLAFNKANSSVDWLDANFYNDPQDGSTVHANRLIWGHVLSGRSNVQMDDWAGSGRDIHFETHLSTSQSVVTLAADSGVATWRVLATIEAQYPDDSMSHPTWEYGGKDLRLEENANLSAVLAGDQSSFEGTVSVPGGGTDTTPVELDIDFSISRTDLEASSPGSPSDVWAVVVFGHPDAMAPDGFAVTWVSNPLRLPLDTPN